MVKGQTNKDRQMYPHSAGTSFCKRPLIVVTILEVFEPINLERLLRNEREIQDGSQEAHSGVRV